MEKIKLLLTFLFCCSFFFLGDIVALLGPTLLDFAHHVSGSDNIIPVIFSVRSIGYLTGSIVGGILYDKYRNKRYAMLAASVVIAALATVLLPFSPTLYTLIPAMFLQGIPLGYLDNGVNILLLRLWDEKSGPYMQALHFSYALGTVVAPLLARPFISHNAIPDIPTSHYCNPSRDDNTTKCDNITRALFPNCTDSSESSLQFGWSYWISAIGMLIVAVPLIYFAGCTKRRHPKLYTDIIEQRENTPSATKQNKNPDNVQHYKAFWIFIVSICTIFLFFYIGIEVTYGSFIFTFSVTYKELCFSKSKAALLNSVYWGSFTFGRLLGVGIAMLKVPTTAMIVADFIGCMVTVVLINVLHTGEIVIWIGSALMGLSIASIFPATLVLVDEHLEVTGRVTAILVNGAALGDMVLPLTVGLLVTNVNPEYFLYLTLAYSSGASVLFVIMLVVSYLWRRYYSANSTAPVHYEPLQEEMNMEETSDMTVEDNVTTTEDNVQTIEITGL
ncbi:sodium-dependent glucose transporter 1A-like [Dysidea avara]|uniref:sodium-dependent glucose transporter 1A-like n=1 Tax=Dysidea avara TaxID=196820 RepID=UPI003331C4ED